MTLPGVEINTSEATQPPTAVTDTGQAFMVGFTERGPHDRYVKCRNLDQVVAAFGGRVAYGYVYDAAEAFFAEGGTVLYVARIIGTAPVRATVDLYDAAGTAAGDVSLVATAVDYGDGPNGWDVVVTTSGTDFTVSVLDADGATLDTTGVVATREDAVAALDGGYVTLTLGASAEDPRAGTYTLAGGDDNHAGATDATQAAALALFPKSLGPGQVLAPGITTQQMHENLLDHAHARNRVALLDAPDSGVPATVLAAATAVRGYGTANEDRVGKMLAPWAVIPGLTLGTTRSVPWSAIEAGITARNDGAGLAPNDNAAGVTNGRARYAVSLKHGPETDGVQWTDTELEALYDGGVNVARLKYGGPVGYGIRTLVDDETSPLWSNFGNAREVMHIRAQSDAIGERYVHRTIDARGYLFGELKGELAGMLRAEWARNALYGASPQEAFTVDTSAAVNTAATIAAREIRARQVVRIGEAGENVIIDVVKVPVDRAVA